MIILDTCVLTEQQRSSPLWEMLFALRMSGTQRVALPEMVLIELLAQRKRHYASAIDKAQAAFNGLWSLQFGDSDGSEHWPAVDSIVNHVAEWERLYRRTFEILPLTGEAAKEGLRREALRIRPAKPTGKEGSRDVAIWMAVLEQARTAPDETVYFVTSNSNDFGKDGRLFPELAAEVAEAGVVITYLGDLKKALADFAERQPLDDDEADLPARVADPRTAAWLHQFVVAQVTPDQFDAVVVDFDDEAPFLEWGTFEGWASSPHVSILSFGEAAVYVTGEMTTPTATVRVLAMGYARRLGWYGEDGVLAAFTFEVRIVFGDNSLTALSVSSLQPPTEDEEDAATEVARSLIRPPDIPPPPRAVAPSHPSNLRRGMARKPTAPETEV